MDGHCIPPDVRHREEPGSFLWFFPPTIHDQSGHEETRNELRLRVLLENEGLVLFGTVRHDRQGTIPD